MRRKRRLILPTFIVILLLGSLGYGGWLWYDANVDRSGWADQDGVRIYRDFYGDPASGWTELADGRYYFNPDGTPRTDWQDIGGNTYFFQPSGAMYTGWLELDGKIYYFGSNGIMVEGWLWREEGRYYLMNGQVSTGWQMIDGGRYYFDGNGIMAMGFTDLDGSRYYFDEGGLLVTGMATIDERIFYFGDDGIMRTGWDETGEGRRYFYPDGPMARGWTAIDGALYYFEENGLLVTGWMTIGEYTYYLHSDGQAAVGPTEIDGQTHYFTPKGIEVVLVNALNPVPDYYEMELINVVGYHDVDARCYDALVRMLEDCTNAGVEYIFNSAYRTIKEQTEILEARTAEHMEEYGLSYEKAKKKALETVAIPGTSEHHLGLAVDLLGSEAVAWLQEHCWDYGFILRYTEEKYPITGIVDEPWHFRYVGTEVSLDMKGSGLCLEEYLGADPVKPETSEDEIQ